MVWIIDVEQWPRALLRAELIERGFDAVGWVTVRDAVESLPERFPDAIVVHLLGQSLPLVERLPGLGCRFWSWPEFRRSTISRTENG